MQESEILSEIQKIFQTTWSQQHATSVPETEELVLGNKAVTLDATVMYADLADSTGLVDNFKPWFAAEMYKAYLSATCKVIRHNAGEIVAFDGDRVMAVFLGKSKNTSAAKCALQINDIVRKINALIKKCYPSTSYALRQAVGIDTSPLFVTKAGVWGANDLVWVGKAANYAAKLCSLCDATFPTYVTSTVFDGMNETSKFGGNPRTSMWEKRIWIAKGSDVYRSSWIWPL